MNHHAVSLSARRNVRLPTRQQLAVSCLTAALGCAAAAAPGDAPALPAPAAAEVWAKGRVLVLPRPGLDDRALAKILKAERATARRVDASGLVVVDLPAGVSESDVAVRLSHHPHLKFVERDRRLAPDFAPNDPYTGSEWHLGMIGAAAAWDRSKGAGVTIAILDSGVDATHPDLASRMVAGWNQFDNNADTADVYGHGTQVAGAAAASLDNGIGVASVAGMAKIMPVRISDSTGYAYWSTIAAGLRWAADHGARVANISYSAAGSSSVQSAASYMKGKGGLVFVSAGNTGANDATAPTTTLIPVAATDSADARASWSTYGNLVALSAPGVSIYTTTRGGGYAAVSGTSFASPISAGVAALVMAAQPGFSAVQVENLLFSTAVDLGAAGRDPYFGYGRVSADAAVQAALGAATPMPDTQPPTAAITAPVGTATVSGLVSVDVAANDNVGVVRVDLLVNGAKVASDTAPPFGFSWDSATAANGIASLIAQAFDAAGNSVASAAVAVNVANAVAVDTTAPVVSFTAPKSERGRGFVQISTAASDDSGAGGLTQSLFVDNVLQATATGAILNFVWDSKGASVGMHQLRVVARDAAGNSSSSTVSVGIKN